MHRFRTRLVGRLLIGTVLATMACSPSVAATPPVPGAAAEIQPPPRKHLVAALLKPNAPTIRENGADRTYELILGRPGR